MLMLALLLAVAPGTKLLDPIAYRQVTVFPIVRTAPVRPADYLTLKEGLSDKLVTVAEHGDVNSVIVKNHTDRALLLVGGEMILGGQQDRIIGQDQLVGPHRNATVAVFCVEHGRWSGGQHFGAAGGIVDAKVRAQAKVHASQQQVWDEVARKTEKLKARTPTGTYRAVGESTQEAIAPYRAAITQAVAKLPSVVGVASAVNGKIVSVDVFADAKLFAGYRDRVLDAVYVEAQDASEERDAPKPTPASVDAFLEKANHSVLRGKGGEAVMDDSIPADY